MKKLLLCLVMILLIFGQACKNANTKSRNVEGSTQSRVNSESLNINLDKETKANTVDLSSSDTTRKLTKEATISFETNDYKTTCLAIRELIAKYRGQIIEESNTKRTNSELEAIYDVRIPSKSFDLFLRELESVDGKMVDKRIKIEDITADYLDVQSRLKSKKELEARYLQLLAKATKVTEMLEIEKQLNEQRTEIESIEGRFKFMQHEVANNLLHITISETKTATSGFFGRTLKAFSNGWSIFVHFLIGLLTLWPFILVGFVIWFISRRYFRHKKDKRIAGIGQL